MSISAPALVEARMNGSPFYWTGKPCKRGHIAKRITSSRQCYECRSDIDKKSYYKYQKKRIAKALRWNKKNEELLKDRRFHNPYKHRARVRKWRKANLDAVSAYVRKKRKTDINFTLAGNLRCRIYQAIKYQCGVKSGRMRSLVGCSINELKKHIEAQFQFGMSWDNHGEWQVDHIKPCANYDLTDPDQQRECFHYSNLQPLWRFDNQSKNKRAA